MLTFRYTKHSGFTIVELLIVIVVIAVLASISVVAYTGIQERAKFSKTRNDIANTQKLIEMYYAQYGHYPIVADPASWNWQTSANKDTYIPGIVPEFSSSLPIVADSSGQYLYRSDSSGSRYKLIKHRGVGNGGISSAEWNLVPSSMKDQYASNMDRYGVWSSVGSSF